jgi:hypothetical protein
VRSTKPPLSYLSFAAGFPDFESSSAKDNFRGKYDAVERDPNMSEELQRKSQERNGADWAGEFLLSLFMTLFAVFVIIESIRMPRRGHLGILMSPGFVPFCTGIVLFFLCMILNVRAVSRGALRNIRIIAGIISRDEESLRFLWILGFLTLYIVVLINLVPFVAATFLFHALVFFYLRIGGWFKIIFYASFAAVLVAVLLPMFFEMPVP